MLNPNTLLLIGVLFLVCHSPMQAQAPSDLYNYSYLKVENGLCDNSVDYIYKDKQGFMWFATANGLDRYNGYEVNHYSTFAEEHRRIKSNFIKEVTEDSYHNLWIASESGLIRLNLLSGEITSFENLTIENASVLSLPIHTVFKDSFGNLWIGYSLGLAYLEFDTEGKMQRINCIEADTDEEIVAICQHGQDIWAGGKESLIHLAQSSKGEFTRVTQSRVQRELPGLVVNCLFSTGEYLWIGTETGLICHNTANNSYIQYQHLIDNPLSLSNNHITCIGQNNSGDILVGTKMGLNFYKRDGSFARHNKNIPGQSLNNNLISSVFVDENDYVWVGTEVGGVNIMTPKRIFFEYQLQGDEDTQNIISCVWEDEERNLLVGIVDGGLAIRLKHEREFRHYRHDVNKNNSLGHNEVSCIVQDMAGDYWIGLKGGGVNRLRKRDLDSPVFDRFTQKTCGIGSDYVTDIAQDNIRGGLWICYEDGIDFMDFEFQSFTRLQYNTESGEPLKNISTIHRDRNNQLWIGGNGLYVVDLNLQDAISGKYFCRYFKYKFDDPQSKIQEKISCIFESEYGSIYYGSLGNGIYELENIPGSDYRFHNYSVNSGLADSMTFQIVEDGSGNLWISTINGVYLFDRKTKRAFKFDAGDGLMSPQFYIRAGYRTSSGNIYLGTINGLVSFNPSVRIPNLKDRKVTLTGIWCDNKELIPYQDTENLSRDISMATECHIYPPGYSIEIAFAALEYEEQKKIFYSYRLVNFEDKPTVRLGARSARYTNLPPGDYIFEVRCTNPDNTWSDQYTRLKLIIHPPFYKTTWFYSLLIFVALFTLFGGIFLYSRNQKDKQKILEKEIRKRTKQLNETMEQLMASQKAVTEQNLILQERNSAISAQKDQLLELSERMKAVNAEKMAFFTNLTHEFKTPLTLILSPVTKLMEQCKEMPQYELLGIIQRNAHHLLSLINQLMDLRKVDTNSVRLSFEDFDFNQFVHSVIHDFSDIFTERNIKLESRVRMAHPIIKSDKANLHKVLFNLFSNAIKFTPNGGKVTARFAQLRCPTNKLKVLQYISVTNSGSSIPENELQSIFERFYRISNQQSYTSYGQSSTGIGLYLVKQIITLLGGEVEVRSNPQKGVTFRMYFPVELSQEASESVVTFDYQSVIPEEEDDIPFTVTDPKKPVLLLVEDNRDMREYIKSILMESYNVGEAINGKKGVEMARLILPDFIVSDLMMPVCDGIGFCKQVKEDEQLCHIPFLLLTAQSSDEARIESYHTGVDGYLTKPFDTSVLLSRIDGILQNRNKAQKRLLEKLGVNLLNIDEVSPDKRFMEKLLLVLKENHTDPDFGVSGLIREMNMSNTLLYKKLVSLTGLSASRFILLYRLQVAKEIMEVSTRELNVSEVAYSVGFNDPKYFTRCFTRQYNIAPSLFMAKKGS